MVFRWLLSLILLLTLHSAAAGEVDRLHQRVSDWTRALGGWLDARLAGEPWPAAENRTRLKLGVRLRVGRLSPLKTDPLIDLRLHLPRLQRKFNLIIQQETPAEAAPAERSGIDRTVQPQGQAQGTFVGLRLGRGDSRFQRTLSNVSAGLVFRGITPGVAIDWRQRDRYPLGRGWVRTDFQRLRWENFTGLYGTLGWDFDLAPSPTELRRLSVSLDGYLEREEIVLNLGAGDTWLLPGNVALSLRLRGSWSNQPRYELVRWGPVLRYSRPLWRPWLLLTLSPELRFDRDYGYRTDPLVTVRLEAVFNR